MQIYEIFNSIEGLGLRQGSLSTFIRTFSCNLNCSYCTAEYCVNPTSDEDLNGYTVMSVDEILDEVADYGNKCVTILGGEPLLQKDLPELVAALLGDGYLVTIETQGASDLKTFESKMVDILVDDENLNNLQYVLDYKLPFSTMEDRMLTANINFLIDNDTLLFNVATVGDLDAVSALLEEFEPPAMVFMVPYQLNDEVIINHLRENNIQKVRIQHNLRKDIYGDDMHA